jgi:hypothetical protein
MLETIEEKSTKVGELENQLSGQLHRVKIVRNLNCCGCNYYILQLIEDFDIMDAHYQSVYEKCCAALNKLEKRKVQVEKLNKVRTFSNGTWRIWPILGFGSDK